MNRNTNMILKAAAISLMLIGLMAMIVAWDLLLVAGIYNSTVIVLEMGGVITLHGGLLPLEAHQEAGRMPISEG